MNNDKKLFKSIVFDVFKDVKYYEQIEFAMLKAYDIFMEDVKSFKKLSLRTKFDMCYSAYMITIASVSDQVKSIRIFTKEKIEKQKYSLYFREEDRKEIIPIKEQKLLDI